MRRSDKGVIGILITRMGCWHNKWGKWRNRWGEGNNCNVGIKKGSIQI